MLGRWLRNRYDNLLPKNYSYDDIYVQSSAMNRTYLSAKCNLAGLYPTQADMIEIIPIKTIPRNEDNIVAGSKFCPRYNREFEKVKNSDEIKRIEAQNKELYDYLTEKSGKVVNDVRKTLYLYNTLNIQVIY